MGVGQAQALRPMQGPRSPRRDGPRRRPLGFGEWLRRVTCRLGCVLVRVLRDLRTPSKVQNKARFLFFPSARYASSASAEKPREYVAQSVSFLFARDTTRVPLTGRVLLRSGVRRGLVEEAQTRLRLVARRARGLDSGDAPGRRSFESAGVDLRNTLLCSFCHKCPPHSRHSQTCPICCAVEMHTALSVHHNATVLRAARALVFLILPRYIYISFS